MGQDRDFVCMYGDYIHLFFLFPSKVSFSPDFAGSGAEFYKTRSGRIRWAAFSPGCLALILEEPTRAVSRTSFDISDSSSGLGVGLPVAFPLS